MKYGFFGGSFNPPTLAHLNIAKQSIKEIGLDKVFIVPVGNTYSKNGLVDEKYRYDMLKLMANGEKNIEIENIELKNKNKLSAFDAFNLIENKYKNSENFYIMGADNLEKIPMWNNAEELLKKFKIIVFERIGTDIENVIKNNYLLSKYRCNIYIIKIIRDYDCRSGIIRDLVAIKKFKEAEKYTKPEIIKYIKENELYKITKST